MLNKETRQKWMLYAYIMLMILILLLRDVAGYNIHKFIIASMVIIVSVLSLYKTLLSVILFTLPLLGGLPGNYFIPIWAVLILYHQCVNHSLNPLAVLFSFIFIIWEVLWCSFLPYSISIASLLSYCAILLIFCLLIAENKQIIDYKYPILAFCLGSCAMLAIIFCIFLNDPSMLLAESGARMGGDEYVKDGKMVLFANANTIGYFSVATISTLLTLLYYKKIKASYCIVLITIALVLGMYSISRTWLVSVVLTFVLYLMFQKVNKGVGYLIFVLSLFILFVFAFTNESIFQAFEHRLTGDEIETGGGRTVLFAKYNDYMFSHPVNFLLGTSSLMYKEVTDVYESTHNAFQQIWISYGVLGFIVFISAFIILFRKYYIKGQRLNLLPMAIILIFLQTIQLLNPHNGLYPLIVAFFIMKMVKKDKQGGLLFSRSI